MFRVAALPVSARDDDRIERKISCHRNTQKHTDHLSPRWTLLVSPRCRFDRESALSYNRALMTLIPQYFNLYDYFLGDERLAEVGRRTAIEFRGSRITYDELRTEVDYWTEQITANGVGEGDRVALLLYDSPEFVACFLAAVSVGAIAVPINTFISPEEVMFIIRDSGARLVIAEEELEWKVSLSGSPFKETCSLVVVTTAERPYLEPKDDLAERPPLPATTRETPAFLLYTSGSTGMPKGALHLHGSIPYTVETYSGEVLRLSEEDRTYSASRLFFAYGLGNSLSFPLAAGAAVLLDAERPTPERLASLLEEQSPTVFFAVPAVYRSLLDLHESGRRVDTSSLRLCISAGEALPPSIFADWERTFGLTALDGIGSTEMLHIFISNREGRARLSSSGEAVGGYAARLCDDDGNEVEGEGTGNLWIRGGSATSGYWNRSELTAETIIDGWVRTGDLYRRDAEGFYYHIGRSDDCFKVRGMWVSPIEVEAALLAHESVVEAAVVSSRDEDGLATVKAYVVIRTGVGDEAMKEDLRELAGSRLPPYKVPSQIEFLKELPRTSTGKIQRYKLRGASQ
ncbi:MAG: benzoate-CoA ligase family protein [Blastocatellia bacterium]|nr:benzoate-CoA ligase family protein [Blastocatellia bacterium]